MSGSTSAARHRRVSHFHTRPCAGGPQQLPTSPHGYRVQEQARHAAKIVEKLKGRGTMEPGREAGRGRPDGVGDGSILLKTRLCFALSSHLSDLRLFSVYHTRQHHPHMWISRAAHTQARSPTPRLLTQRAAGGGFRSPRSSAAQVHRVGASKSGLTSLTTKLRPLAGRLSGT